VRKHHAIKTILHALLSSVLDESQWSVSRSGRFTTPSPARGKSRPKPLDRRLGGPQRQSGCEIKIPAGDCTLIVCPDLF
jgi:hypothetical protein